MITRNRLGTYDILMGADGIPIAGYHFQYNCEVCKNHFTSSTERTTCQDCRKR